MVNPPPGNSTPDHSHNLTLGCRHRYAQQGAQHHYGGRGHHRDEPQGGGHGSDLGAQGHDDPATEDEQAQGDPDASPD